MGIFRTSYIRSKIQLIEYILINFHILCSISLNKNVQLLIPNSSRYLRSTYHPYYTRWKTVVVRFTAERDELLSSQEELQQ